MSTASATNKYPTGTSTAAPSYHSPVPVAPFDPARRCRAAQALIGFSCFALAFLGCPGRVVKPDTTRQMTRNQNPAGVRPRGLGFDVGGAAGSPGCSDRTFGHTGSTGTLCWADPATDTVCVVLTSLPRRAGQRHPGDEAAERVAAASR